VYICVKFESYNAMNYVVAKCSYIYNMHDISPA